MNDPLADLRKVKVPLWARLIGAWRARKHRKVELQRTIFVCTLKAWVWHRDQKRHVYGWYNLYRNAAGKRWYEYGTSNSDIFNWEKRHSLYGTHIDPWMHGTWDDEAMRQCARALEYEPGTPK